MATFRRRSERASAVVLALAGRLAAEPPRPTPARAAGGVGRRRPRLEGT